MRRRLGLIASAAALVVVALFAASVPAFADSSTPPPPPPPTTPQQEAFRANVQSLFDGLTNVVAGVQANPNTAPGLQKAGSDPNSMIASAKTQVASLNSRDLDELQAALAADPSWQQIPATIQTSVNAFKPAPSPHASAAQGSVKPFATAGSFPGTFTGDCSTAGDPYGEFIATTVANEAQSAAQAVMLSTPGVVAIFFVDVPTGVKIAEAVIWGVLNAVYLALSQALAVATDCAATGFSNIQSSTFPVDGSGNVIQGSSQVSVNNLTTLAQGTATEIAAVQGTVNAVATQTDNLVTAANTINTTVTDITRGPTRSRLTYRPSRPTSPCWRAPR
jgi:hypothetical protein